MSRGPVLDRHVLQTIVAAIHGMDQSATWASVVHVAAAATGHTYTRQTLAKHPCVLAAVRARRVEGPAQGVGRRRASKPANSLRAELEKVKAERWKLEEQLIRITESAYALGISEQRLLQPRILGKQAPGSGGPPDHPL